MKDHGTTRLRLSYGVASETTRQEIKDDGTSAVVSAVGGSGGKPGRCFASVTGPQADARWLRRPRRIAAQQRDEGVASTSPATALGTTRSTTNALTTAHTTARRTCESGPVRRSLGEGGFTLVELSVSVGVLVLIVFLATQLLNSAATITTLGHKQMDADTQARLLLDRMAVDFAQLVKRTDLDFFGKGTNAPNSVGGPMAGNDQIAFYSAVPGYYPPTGSQSPVSLVGYRVNSLSTSSSYNKLERMGKGLVWNGVSQTDIPVVFMPLTISATWPAATSSSLPDTTAYEVIGPQVFRFEYCYLLTANGALSITPPSDISGIAAIVVDIAVIDPQSKVVLGSTEAQINTQIAKFSTPSDSQHFLADYTSGMTPGQLRTQWQNRLNGIINPNSPNYDPSFPQPAISGIRLYERFFYLSPPKL